MSLSKLALPPSFNYVAAFLNFSCQLRCNYCINHHEGELVKKRRMSAADWITSLDRLHLPQDCPITLQGGEPTIYPGFYEICQHKPLWGKLDLLTNLVLDEDVFMSKVSPEVFKRGAPYASIRVSWHIGQNSGPDLLRRVSKMQAKGYEIGIWAVSHPDYEMDILEAQHTAKHLGIDFRIKEFLGPWKGVNHGTLRYPGAVNGDKLRYCECRTSELLIAPDGLVYRCHSDLYAARMPLGSILNSHIPLLGQWVPCSAYGRCNSCDIKVKFNRYQQPDHSSVEVRSLSAPYAQNADKVNDVENTYGKADAK